MSHRTLGRVRAVTVLALVASLAVVAVPGTASAAPTAPSRGPTTAAMSGPGGEHGAPRLDAASTAPTGAWTAGGLIDTGSSAPALSAPAPSGFAQVGGCTFYASSSSAGGFCSSGDAIDVPTLAQWLEGRTFYPCRFFSIPEGMVINAPSPEGGRWMLKACFEGWDLAAAWGGNDIRVEVAAQWVRDGDNTDVPGYMEQFWSVQSDLNYYPLPRINFAPSTPFRVGTYSYFWATWVEALDSRKQTEPEYRIAYNTTTQGTVYLHAVIDEVTIFPGVEDSEPIDCGRADDPFDGSARDDIPETEGGDQESDCWTVFEHSTATEDRLTVQMRAQATWRVTVESPGGQVLAALGDFSYTTQQRLAVGEVQTEADW